MVLKEDEAAFFERARRFARDNDIFLLMGMGTLEPGAARPVDNKAVLVNPAGEIVYSYTKITAVPGFEPTAMDDFTAQDSVMVAQVPTAAGVRTIYARVGDLFAWLCVTGMQGGIGWAVIRSLR